MAQEPKPISGSRLSNIMGSLRGNFDFRKKAGDPVAPAVYGGAQLTPQEERRRILQGGLAIAQNRPALRNGAASLMTLAQASFSKIGHNRIEYRKIIQLMPQVGKAARLKVASIFSPNDLSRHDISVVTRCESLGDDLTSKLHAELTEFFETALRLKTNAPDWVYKFGYEAGVHVLAIIPTGTLATIAEDAYIGTESFTKNVLTPLSQDSLFGFCDQPQGSRSRSADFGLESFCREAFAQQCPDSKSAHRIRKSVDTVPVNELLSKMIGQEALSLTDNPAVLQASSVAKTKRQQRLKTKLHDRYKLPKAEPVVTVTTPVHDGIPSDEPIVMRLPPESVTVIHTPGNPSDHQGYLVLLDRSGNPIDSTLHLASGARDLRQDQSSVFNQAYMAYGYGSPSADINDDTKTALYTQIVTEHLRKRLDKAGVSDVELNLSDSVMRCMFTRYLQAKQTRILFLPKDLVTYMTFEFDDQGYGVSRIERVKFNLGMKMALQVSRVLAAIKAATDRRKIDIKFTGEMMEQPESLIGDVISEWVNKSTMDFNIDPNVIQTQIANKSMSVKATDVPGFENFEVTNEPDQRTSSVDFDPGMTEYIDKEILNGLDVPAATMNSLSEDEYARSVATTNLFFSMDVSIDQDIVIKYVTDVIQKYARHSRSFYTKVYTLLPGLRDKATAKAMIGTDSSHDDAVEGQSLPDGFSVATLIDSLSIALPIPNVAPDKAQFEALSAMTDAIKNLMDTLFPDDLIGGNDQLRGALQLIKARFSSLNIRNYLEGSGISGVVAPESNFAQELDTLTKLHDALHNVANMIKTKAELGESATADNTDTAVKGY